MAVSRFVYRPAPGWGSGAAEESIAQALGSRETRAASATAVATHEPISQIETRTYEEGLREGIARASTEAEASLNRQRDLIAHALRDFFHERDAYFHHVESEVVSLTLAIVRKILRRESQVDPLLLSALVRVALEKLAVSQTVRLRVHPSQIAAWRDYFSQQADLPIAPELLGDAALDQDQCRLETELGATDLSLETQLKEIEQGLFDLLAQRPAAR